VNEGRPAVFLDRDGVINRAIERDGTAYSPMQLSEFEFLPGVIKACAELHEAGLPLVVVTNQPEIARKRLSLETLEAMHEEIRRQLPVLDILYCGHDDQDRCPCRKPKPGMILDASRRHGLDPTKSVMIGDRWKDIAAGSAAGCSTIQVGPGYSHELILSMPDASSSSLAEATALIFQLIK
jgi:D-glycero-D-manno-heptose 1,7-bisphosphate phosphatase